MTGRLLVAVHAAREGGTAPALLRSLAPLGATTLVLDQTADPAVVAASAAIGAELVPLAQPLRRPAAWAHALVLAQERGAAFLLVVEDAVQIDAEPVRRLLAMLEDEPRLAALSPARIAEARGEPATYRARWDLETIALGRDPSLPHRDCALLDADFCESDVALLRVGALTEVGGFDAAFGDLFADADLGFRLRVAGWGLASMPGAQAQALGFAAPDLGAPSREDDRALFARLHLGYGVVTVDDARLCLPLWLGSEGAVDLLRRHGLARASGLPLPRVLAAGNAAGHPLTLGVDTNVFSPWGPVETRPDGPTFLWMSPRGGRGGFGAVREAWRAFRAAGGRGSLLCMGQGLVRAMDAPSRLLGTTRVAELPAAGITLIEPRVPFAPAELAALLRGIDIVLTREGRPDRAVLHAMACGAVPIALADGDPAAALLRAAALSAAERASASAEAVRTVRDGWTLRRSAFALRAALTVLQEREEVETRPAPAPAMRTARPAMAAMVDYALGLAARDVPRPSVFRRLPFLRRRPDPADFAEFDAEAYLRENPDVAAAGVSPLNHFAREGWLEGRRLSARLDTRRYLLANTRARQALLDIHAGRRAPPSGTATAPPAVRKPGILIVGYVEAGLGLGESTRGLARALAETDVPFALHPYNQSVEGRFSGPFMPERTDRTGAYDVTLFEAAGDQLPDFLDQFAARMAGSHAIFRTYWELAEAPRAWARNLSRFDEIWAPTCFVAEAFRRVFDGPITIVPPCVSVAEKAGLGRAAFGLPREDFLFAFTFDFDSVPARKNPFGLVEAFQAAFPPGESGVGLVLKATGAPHRAPASRAALALAARRDPRIVLLDGAIPRGEVLSLIRACDCYVSLHRSEGFGYGMAESLALGRPVIGTDYSGSTDFLDEETGYPVPWRLRALRDGEYPHAIEGGEAQAWAEPDLAAAAALMQRVRTDAAGRTARTEAGRRRIAERFSAETVGLIATDRLRAILRERGV
jgi:glycosyltransferase involved in cell wall biosynthesis